MTRWQQTVEVARWEFARFVKWRQQFIGLAVMLVIGFGAGLVGRAVGKSESKPVLVAAIGAELLGYPLPASPPVVWDTARNWSAAEARDAVADETLGGLLIVSSPTSVELVLRKRAGWTDPLERSLNSARQQATMARLVATPEDLAAISTPLQFVTSIVQSGVAPVARSTKILTVAILGFGLTILLSGFGTLFVGITGEKTHRVTEQMMAMIRPQTWMDGKIIGLSGAAISGTLILFAGFALIGRAVPAALGRPAFVLPPIASDYGTLALIALVTLLGTAMWFSFMAALAATIDDPNSSTRSLLLFVPMLPMGLAFALVNKADSTAAVVLSIVPFTSMAVLPLRLVLTSVAWWEVVLSVLTLLSAAFLFRSAAGKVFATAMLMHGKEPSFREMWRWARQPESEQS
jgi:ABC-2 type transport system permease protein